MTERRKQMLNQLEIIYNTTDDEKKFFIEFKKACEEIPDTIIGNIQVTIMFETVIYNKFEEWLNS